MRQRLAKSLTAFAVTAASFGSPFRSGAAIVEFTYGGTVLAVSRTPGTPPPVAFDSAVPGDEYSFSVFFDESIPNICGGGCATSGQEGLYAAQSVTLVIGSESFSWSGSARPVLDVMNDEHFPAGPYDGPPPAPPPPPDTVRDFFSVDTDPYFFLPGGDGYLIQADVFLQDLNALGLTPTSLSSNAIPFAPTVDGSIPWTSTQFNMFAVNPERTLTSWS